jgi:nucleoside-diphosphate-sugar epimerase
MNILLFGAGGYIGSVLTGELLARGHFVCAADRWFFGHKPDGISGKLHVMTADIRNVAEWMQGGFKGSGEDKYDAVIDLAGLSNDATAEIDPELTHSINRDGAIRLAEAAKQAGVSRYLYASSASVYGHGDKHNLTETDVCNPVSLYAQCKMLVEDHLRSIAGDGFEPVILRNATVFGYAPRMRFDLAVNIMTLRAWKDHVFYIMGGGGQMRPFVHIKDLVHVFALMLGAPAELVAGETFNVGSDENNYSIKHLAWKISRSFPMAQVHTIPDNIDQRDYHLSFAKLAKLIEPYKWRGIMEGVQEITAELELNPDLATDPTTHTLNWYKSLLEWDKRITGLKLDGRLLS